MSAGIVPLLGLGASIFGSLNAAAAQKKALKAQQKQQELADLREKRKLLRQAQIASGSTVNTAAAIGGMGSSGLSGGLASLTNQAQSQIGYQAQSSLLSKQASNYMQTAQNWNTFSDFGAMFSKIGA